MSNSENSTMTPLTVDELKDKCLLFYTRMDPGKPKREREKEASDRLIRYAFAEFGIINEIPKDGHGKPYVDTEGFCFNLSHSGDYAVLGVTGTEIGVDVQKPVRYKESLLERIAAPDEVNLIKNGFPFERFWAIKESYTKFTGLGIGTDFSKITFKETDRGYTILFIDKEAACAMTVELFEGYGLSVCTDKPKTVETVFVEGVF